MTDNVIDKANSLMRRHRAFVAGEATSVNNATAVPPAPTFAAAKADAEDIPLLTEVVADAGAMELPAVANSAEIEALLRERLAAALPQQRELLRRELAVWLDEQLPQIVMRVLDGVTDQLVAQINTQARMALLPKLQAALDNDNSGLSAED